MSSRGFNRGRYYGKNHWRGGYKARNGFRRRGSGPGQPTRAEENTLGSNLDPDDPPIVGIDEIKNSNPATTQTVRRMKKVVKSPYAGWDQYFPDNDYKLSTVIIRKVKAVEEFMNQNSNLFDEEEIEESRSCVFDLRTLNSDEKFLENWPSFKNDLFSEPMETLDCMGLAVHQILWKSMKEQSCASDSEITSIIKVPIIKARVINNDSLTQLKNLKTQSYGKLASVYGTIIRVSNIKLQCSWLAFECPGCGAVQSVRQPDGIFTVPKICTGYQCGIRTFNPLRSSPHTHTFDVQTIRLQEVMQDQTYERGRVPRTIECELSEDLVNSCAPGDMITISGIVKVRNEDETIKKNKGPKMFTLYLEAISVINCKNMECVGGNKDNGLAVQFSSKDYDAIQLIQSQEELFKLLVHSLCPAIYGHEMVKAGLLLSLFGGSQTEGLGNRNQAHILVVGDPGLGKSQMLQACSFVAPRGVFVCGNTTTSSGLTVTLSKEGGDYALEAGALVLADQGCCCIDEFDKMTTQHQALLEVMEQQTVSIAKAGVICMLPARTTVLAAANPAGGHYDKSKTVAENLRMGPALLSRFDLVFILLDKPNEEIDSLLSRHVMNIHSGFNRKTHIVNVDDFVANHTSGNTSETLSFRLKKKPSEDLDLIPPQLLRKYIAYSRKYVSNVELSDDARKALQQFYLQMRENHYTMDSSPVTTRQLLSLIRLTQARAKLELRLEATIEDALDVIDIVKCSLIDTFSDEYGTLDFSRSQNGSGMSSRNQAKRFLTVLNKNCSILSRNVFTVAEMKEFAKLAALDISNFSSFIMSLNTQGHILKKGINKYQFLSAD